MSSEARTVHQAYLAGELPDATQLRWVTPSRNWPATFDLEATDELSEKGQFAWILVPPFGNHKGMSVTALWSELRWSEPAPAVEDSEASADDIPGGYVFYESQEARQKLFAKFLTPREALLLSLLINLCIKRAAGQTVAAQLNEMLATSCINPGVMLRIYELQPDQRPDVTEADFVGIQKKLRALMLGTEIES